jgi:hypothetical protein
MIKFTLEECNRIVEISYRLEENHSSVIFKDDKKTFDYFYYTIPRNESTQWIFDKLHQYLIEFFPNSCMNKHPQLYLHKYLPGCKFERHNDSTTHPDQLVNLGVCLNNSYIGGEFIFYNPYTTLPKVPGTIYHMDSHRDHEVLEITEGVRWSLITFLKSKDIGISHNKLF